MAQSKENSSIWSKFQSDNRKLPDSKERVRFLLDEIALLENKDRQDGSPALVKAKPPLSISNSNSNSKKEVSVEITDDIVQVEVAAAAAFEGALDETTWTYERFLENAEKVALVLTDTADFCERAAQQLQATNTDQWEIAKLLELEKSKLLRYTTLVEELKKRLSRSFNSRGDSAVCTHGQDLVDKLGQLLNERESFHLKFEVQMELGHVFRLLKLLELHKTKQEACRKELNKVLYNIRVAIQMEQENIIEDLDADDASAYSYGVEEAQGQQDADEGSDREDDGVRIIKEIRKEAKVELLEVVAEQEKAWQARQHIVDELERRLALSEQENQRLADALADSKCQESNLAPEVPSWTSNTPEGYTSVYYSPIFQEQRKPKPKAREGYDDEIMDEIARLKSQLKRKPRSNEDYLSERDVPMEEKTIPVDSTSSDDEFLKLSKALDALDLELFSHPDDNEVPDCVLDDKLFLKTLVQNLLMLFKLHGDHSRKTQVSTLRSELCRQMNELMEEIDVRTGKESNALHSKGSLYSETQQAEALKNQIEQLRLERARDAQELESKKKALAYTQDLNRQLASEKSASENALAELWIEYNDMKSSFKQKLEDAKTEAEDSVKRLKRDFDALKQKVQSAEECRIRLQACLREVDAAALEKEGLLARIHILTEEVTEHSNHVSRLQQSLEEYRTTSLEAKAKLEDSEGNAQLVSILKDELKGMDQDRKNLQRKLVESDYELAQREAALERLTLHLAVAAENRSVNQVKSTESLRSKHSKVEKAKKTIAEQEEKMDSMSLDWSKAKMEMDEIRSFVRQIHR